MRLNLKVSVFTALFSIGVSGLGAPKWSQTGRIDKEYPAEYGLRDVIIERADPSLCPQFFVYTGRAVPAENSGRKTIIWRAAGDIVLSPGHSLIGVFSPGAAPTRTDEPQRYDFRVFDSGGQVIFNLSGMLLNIAERPFCFLTDSKLALITCSYWGDELQFYDRQGQLLNERHFLQEGTLSLINPKGIFDESGHLFFFNLSRARAEEEKVGPDLFMFSANGARIWQYQLPLKSTGALGLSPSGKIAAVSGTVINPKPPQPAFQTILFDSLGNILNSFPVAFRHCDFDRDEKWLLLGGHYKASLVSLIKKSIYLELTPGSGQRVITDCALLADNRILILTGLESSRNGATLYDDPEILIYSPEGQLIFRHIFESDYTYSGNLILNDTRDRFGITLQNRFVVFGVNP